MAQDMGLIPQASDYAYKCVEGMYIFGKGVDAAFELHYREEDKRIREKYKYVELRGENLKVI